MPPLTLNQLVSDYAIYQARERPTALNLDVLVSKLAELETGLGGGAGYGLGWYNVRDYGATGDGVTDDRAALQALIDLVATAGGGTIYFPPGRYRVDRHPTIGATNAGSLSIGGFTAQENIRLTGAGKKSLILQEGDTNPFGGAWYGIWIRNKAKNIEIDHLAFGQGQIPNHDEQTHSIDVHAITNFTGDIQNVHIHHCYFGFIEGDSIRVSGEPDQEVKNLIITDNVFVGTDHQPGDGAVTVGTRSSIGLQRRFSGIIIANNYMTGADDQMIDFEPTGDDTSTEGEDIICNNFIRTTNGGGFAVTLSGAGSTAAHRNWVFAHNIILGGRVNGNAVDHGIFQGNIIVSDAGATADGVVSFDRVADFMRIDSNIIVVPAGCGGTPIIVAGDTLGTPKAVTITNNIIEMANVQNAIQAQACVDATISGNLIRATAAGLDTGNKYGIVWKPDRANTGKRLLVQGNRLESSGSNFDGFLLISGEGRFFGQVVVNGNLAQGIEKGVFFSGGAGAGYDFPPVVTGNDFAATVQTIDMAASHSPAMYCIIGGNGGPTEPRTIIHQSNGDPNALTTLDSQPIGSQFINRAAGATKKVWVKNAAGASGWVALD